jgi:hypothetical protein
MDAQYSSGNEQLQQEIPGAGFLVIPVEKIKV